MRYFIYQVNPKLGDLVGNYSKIKDEFLKQKDKVDIFILPELVISGYPPEDLLLADYFLDKLIKLQEDLIKLTKGANSSLIFGGVEREGGNLYNSAFVASKGKIVDIVRKSNLPNYGVFDEKRYFVEGDDELKILEISGVKTLLLICEDFWQENLLTEIAKLKFDLIITINASPYEDNKFTKKLDIAKKLVKKSKKELIYVNMVGGQDSLVFDGRSFVVGSNSEIIKILDGFQEAKFLYDGKELKSQQYSYSFSSESYLALVLGLRDYVFKNGFDEVVLGLSGGIDSAFVACLACDALGSDKVNLVMMPSQYTSTESIKDAEDIAAALGCSNLLNIGIEKIYEESIRSLKKSFKGKGADLTEENLQARIRGNIIMALANKHNYLALATSNKSESAVGYATL